MVQGNKLNNKKSSSLVIKLNLKMLGRLVAGFMALNSLIIIMGFSVILWKVEDGNQGIIKTIELHSDKPYREYYSIKGYKIMKTEEQPRGYKFPQFIQKIFQRNISDKSFNEIRSIELIKGGPGLSFPDKLDLIKYHILFPINGEGYNVEYTLGPDLRLFLYLMIIIFTFELLIIVGNIGKGARIIRNTLKPLTELSETAKTLNAKVHSMGSEINDKELKDLTGAISSIDANKLDKGITIDSSQDELKDLAYAINNMLNRINASYRSQVQFVSDASHELRTPISVIQGYVNLLDRWGKNDEKTMQESIDAIKGETHNMKDLVEQLLFLARGDNETIQLHQENFDVCEVVDVIVREMQMIDSDHVFETVLQGPICIDADKQLIKQAIRILIDNSIKYTPVNEKISLKVTEEDGFAYIIVQDNGIGIAPEDISRIFNRFYRSDKSRARDTGGSGLGLSIARWIIERHGAHFEVLSRVDIGTRITIVFPISTC